MKIFDTLPLTELGLILLAVTMVAFYSTTFDALTMVVSSYSYKRLKPEQEPDKRIRTFWAVVFTFIIVGSTLSVNIIVGSIMVVAGVAVATLVSRKKDNKQ